MRLEIGVRDEAKIESRAMVWLGVEMLFLSVIQLANEDVPLEPIPCFMCWIIAWLSSESNLRKHRTRFYLAPLCAGFSFQDLAMNLALPPDKTWMAR